MFKNVLSVSIGLVATGISIYFRMPMWGAVSLGLVGYGVSTYTSIVANRKNAQCIELPSMNQESSLEKIRQQSWHLSRLIETESIEPGASDIRKINKFNCELEKNKKDFANKYQCEASDIDDLKIMLPKSDRQRLFEKLGRTVLYPTLFVRSWFVIYPAFATISFAHKFFPKKLLHTILPKEMFEPTSITNHKTPVLLIHGSHANGRQWALFRYLLQSDTIGHLFEVDLNERFLINDEKNITQYARQRVANKIRDMKNLYKKEGLDLKKIILMGHSMGGLVSGASFDIVEDVEVKAIIFMNTPWHGSWIANLGARFGLVQETKKPDAAFIPNNVERNHIKKDIIDRALKLNAQTKLYTVSGGVDIPVDHFSASLPIQPAHQIHAWWSDHYGTMVNPFLPSRIRKEQIQPNTEVLERIEEAQSEDDKPLALRLR